MMLFDESNDYEYRSYNTICLGALGSVHLDILLSNGRWSVLLGIFFAKYEGENIQLMLPPYLLHRFPSLLSKSR